MSDKEWNFDLYLTNQANGQALHVELSISDVSDMLLLHFLPEEFAVITDSHEVRVPNPEEKETIVGEGRVLKLAGKMVFFMVQFHFDASEGEVGGFKKAVIYQGDFNDQTRELVSSERLSSLEIASLGTQDLVRILVPVLERVVKEEGRFSH